MTSPLCQTPLGFNETTINNSLVAGGDSALLGKQLIKTAASVANNANQSIDLEVSSIGFGHIN